MSSIIPLFAVPVFKDDFFLSLADRYFCSRLITRHDEPANFYLTTNSRVLDLPQLSKMKSSAQSAMNFYTREILHMPDSVHLNITTSWYTTVTNHSRVSTHYHSHSIFTGVIVFDASPGSRLILSVETPPIVPKMFEFNYTEFNIFNSKSWWLDLEPNTIYIFPSTINHSAELLDENTSMNLLAFDTFVNGSIGEDLNGIHVTTL